MSPYNPAHHRRRSTRLKGYDYTQPGAYFITICTYQREHLFGQVEGGKMVLNAYGDIVAEEWFKSAQVRDTIDLFEDEFVVMPNHIHGIIWITSDPTVGVTRRVAPTTPKSPCGPPSGSIGAIIGQFKSLVAKRINKIRGLSGLPVWQRNYHDRIIRDHTELDLIRAYIADNPRRWSEDRYYAHQSV